MAAGCYARLLRRQSYRAIFGRDTVCLSDPEVESSSLQAMSSGAPSSSGPTPTNRSPVSRSLTFIAAADAVPPTLDTAQLQPHDSSDAAGEEQPVAELPPEEQAKHHLRQVRRLCEKFDRQVRGLS